MPKFTVSADFTLYTEIQPDFYRESPGDSSANDYQDNSYFDSTTVECSGGNITFWVEADGRGRREAQGRGRHR